MTIGIFASGFELSFDFLLYAATASMPSPTITGTIQRSEEFNSSVEVSSFTFCTCQLRNSADMLADSSSFPYGTDTEISSSEMSNWAGCWISPSFDNCSSKA